MAKASKSIDPLDLLEDAASPPAPVDPWEDAAPGETGASRRQVAALVAKATALCKELVADEEAIAKKKAALRNITHRLLPEMMDEAGMLEFTSVDGFEIRVSDKVYASLPKDPERNAKALDWLRKAGLEWIIKPTITVQFPAGQEAASEAWFQGLRKRPDAPDKIARVDDVHPSSLAAAIRARLEKGLPIPFEDLGAYVERVATIKEK